MTDVESLIHMTSSLTDGAARLREVVLHAAVHGTLVPQSRSDEPADVLLTRSRAAVDRQTLEGKCKREKPAAPLDPTEQHFDLPAGWTWARIVDTGQYINGLAFKPSDWKAKGRPIIRIQNLSGRNAEFNYTDGTFDHSVVVHDGDILVSWSATLDAFIWRGVEGVLNQHIFRVVPAPLVDKRYLYWLLKWVIRRMAASDHVHGLVMGHINRGPFLAFPVPIPPLAEQKRIVAKVDELMALCDRLEAQLKQRDEQAGVLAKAAVARFQADPTAENLEYLFHETYEIDADLIRQAILRLAVRGRFETQHASDKPAADAIEEAGALPPPARYEGRSRATIQGLGGLSVGPSMLAIPPGWQCVPLIKIARIESGHTPSRSRPEWWGGDVPWIGVSDARKHNGGTIHQTHQTTNALGLANSAARLLPTGTVCVSRTASVGYVVVLGRPMATSQDFVNWVPGQAVSSEWLRLVFMAERDGFHLFSKGAVHQTIYYPEWLSMHILLPPIAEQRRIVAKANELMALVDQLESQITASEEAGAKLLDALVAELAPSN